MQEWQARKTAHVSALFANSNVDMEKSSDAVSKLELAYDETMAMIWNGPGQREAEEKALESNPFMQASRRQLGAMGMKLPGQEEIESLP